MKAATYRKGFTLIEVVIAAAIILSIFSVLYGTYFSISGATKTVRAKQELSQQAADMMTRLARQIRCSYATNTANENKVDYFYGKSDSIGEVMYFITTNSFFVLPADASEGLFDVAYKFDRNEGVLYVSQRKFVGSTKKTARKEWVPIAENVKSFDVEFFDGQRWFDRWAYNDKQKLPSAVKIDIAFENQTNRIYKCSTSVNVYCGTGNEKAAVPGKLATAKK